MRASAWIVLAALASLAAPGPASGQSAERALAIRTVPAVPVLGSVAWLELRPGAEADSLLAVAGEAADEPLHFAAADGGGFRALFGLPVDGPDTVTISLRLQRADRTDTVAVALGVSRGSYGREELRVKPGLARLDSAARVRVESERERSREVSRRSHETPRLWTLPFQVPRSGRITSVFGTAREFNGEITSRHLGTDFAGAVGAPVRAAGRGVVALVADFYLAGRAVYLDHGEGLVTGYFHLSRVDVAEGDTVRAGQVVGGVGRTGRVTGPHLHWIARYGLVTVDPMSLVRLPDS